MPYCFHIYRLKQRYFHFISQPHVLQIIYYTLQPLPPISAWQHCIWFSQGSGMGAGRIFSGGSRSGEISCYDSKL